VARRASCTSRQPGTNGGSTVDPAEIAKFSKLSEEWWNPSGKMAPLHKINPLRLAYIRDAAARKFERNVKSLNCLSGLRVLDIGCGDGTMLDHSLFVYGSNMSNSNAHNHYPLPTSFVGGWKTVKGNRHVVAPEKTPLANVLLTFLDKINVGQDKLGDSTGKLVEA